jgi:hypothetical protein
MSFKRYNIWINVFCGPSRLIWTKQNPQNNITPYQIGAAVSMCTCISTLESTEYYSLNLDRAPEHLVFISDTSETITCIETSSRSGAPFYVPSTSETTSQNALFTPAGPSTSAADISWFPDDLPDEMTPSKLLN